MSHIFVCIRLITNYSSISHWLLIDFICHNLVMLGDKGSQEGKPILSEIRLTLSLMLCLFFFFFQTFKFTFFLSPSLRDLRLITDFLYFFYTLSLYLIWLFRFSSLIAINSWLENIGVRAIFCQGGGGGGGKTFAQKNNASFPNF